MGADYLEEDYDSVAAELARLPPGFDAGVLDAIVDRRSWVLEVRACTWSSRDESRLVECQMLSDAWHRLLLAAAH